MKVIKDFKKYLDVIDKLSKDIPKEKQRELETILSSLLTLLVCLKQNSNLGRHSINWKFFNEERK